MKINEGEDLSIEKDDISPEGFTLQKNYPNPLNPHTKINYSLSESSQISLIVYNNLGQIVKILDNGFKKKGAHSVTFNGSGLASGTYFYQLSSKDFIMTNKMILLKWV